MLPLLALGLLAGGALGQDWYKNRQSAELAEALGPLLGKAPEAMGPEDPSTGRMGLSGGAGLLADPADPTRQMQFARGLLGLPGGMQALQAFDPMLGRALQSKQWTQSQERQAQQYEQTESRLSEQFGKQFGLSQQQADEMARQHIVQQQQWEQTFAQQQAESRARQANQASQLDIERQRLGLERGKALAGEGPKLSTGYMYAPSASGIVAMPMPGTQDYAKAKDGEGALQAADRQIGELLDTFMGKEQITPAGKKVRVGGSGTELWGEQASRMSMLRAQIVASLGKMQDAGVLQEGDFKRYEGLLPDPSSWSGPLSRNKSALTSYNTLRDEFGDKLKRHRDANPWLVPPPPPGTVPR
jgi:hypothetical protein